MSTSAERVRRYRERQKALQKGDVTGADVTGKDVTEKVTLEQRLPWPLNKAKASRWGEGVAMYVAPSVDEKAAMAEHVVSREAVGGKPAGATKVEWEYALVRAERAQRYARMFPDHIRPGEGVFQDPLWQWENETRGKM
jgi:hypothetical protein